MFWSEHVYCVAIAFTMTEQVQQWICIIFCIKFEHSSMEITQMIQKVQLWATSICQFHHNNALAHTSHLTSRVEFFLWNIQLTRWLTSLQLKLLICDFWLFPKLKSPLKGKRFQTISEIQGNMTGQLMAVGRTVWGPKVLTLKGTEASLSYVHCFLSFVSSAINISIFHIIWLDTFWTDLICIYI